MGARIVRDGTSASPGIVVGPAFVLRWDMPSVPHNSVRPEAVADEVDRFHAAREWAKERIAEIKTETASRLGKVEARIFEPQLLMLDDADLVDRVVGYIRDNHFNAARAFELCMIEYEAEWTRTGHPMIMDRLNDLLDVELRVLRRLMELPDPDLDMGRVAERVILIARDVTPTITVQLDRSRIVGIATDAGTRTSHASILARSLGLPAVAGLGDISQLAANGQRVALDGRAGRVILDPTDQEVRSYEEREDRVRQWEHEISLQAQDEAITPDHQPVVVRANVDLPGEAGPAREQGAQGIGLFRTEFLVVGRSMPPDEEEQYEAYRSVAEAFPKQAIFLRTYDLGGDKFPHFLNMPNEENPFLGWRGIRVCLDTPELFRTQLRAALRATAHGDVRIMLPLINDIGEIRAARKLLREEAAALEAEGLPFNSEYKLGIMIETPAAALSAPDLARHADFFSIGTNDLVQYTLAVDRGNARLAPRFTPFHPSVLRLLKRTAEAGRAAGIEVSVCGEMAGNPLAIFFFLGVGINALSVGLGSLPETKAVIRSVPAAAARDTAARVLELATVDEVITTLRAELSTWIDLSLFSDRWNLSPLAGTF